MFWRIVCREFPIVNKVREVKFRGVVEVLGRSLENRLDNEEGLLPWQLARYIRRPNYSTPIVPEIIPHTHSPISCTVSRDTQVTRTRSR
jgi:hypothetical protein